MPVASLGLSLSSLLIDTAINYYVVKQLLGVKIARLPGPFDTLYTCQIAGGM